MKLALFNLWFSSLLSNTADLSKRVPMDEQTWNDDFRLIKMHRGAFRKSVLWQSGYQRLMLAKCIYQWMIRHSFVREVWHFHWDREEPNWKWTRKAFLMFSIFFFIIFSLITVFNVCFTKKNLKEPNWQSFWFNELFFVWRKIICLASINWLVKFYICYSIHFYWDFSDKTGWFWKSSATVRPILEQKGEKESLLESDYHWCFKFFFGMSWPYKKFSFAFSPVKFLDTLKSSSNRVFVLSNRTMFDILTLLT